MVNNGGGASEIGVRQATLNGNLTTPLPADVLVYWGENDGGTNHGDWEQSGLLTGLTNGSFSLPVTGFYYGVTYHYRTYASNLNGEAWAPASTRFKTLPVFYVQPDRLGDVKLWLNASSLGLPDNAVVNVWPDDSGNGHDVDILNGASDPRQVLNGLNGHPVVRYDGNDQQYTTHNFIDLGDYTIFSVARYTNPSGGNASRRVISSEGGNWLFGFWNQFNASWFAQGWIHYRGGNAGTNWQVHTGTMTDDLDPVASFWNNGILLTSNDKESGVPPTPRQLSLGAYNNLGESSEAEIAEIIIFDRVLTEEEIGWIGGYLEGRYDLGLPYPPADTAAVAIAHASPVDVTPTSATARAILETEGAVGHVTVFWGPTDGGTNAGAWANSVTVGSFTDVVQLVISQPLNAPGVNLQPLHLPLEGTQRSLGLVSSHRQAYM
ncbi:MAG: hypothetical protein AAF492_06375 [Verrucomicrobiota bacterium]